MLGLIKKQLEKRNIKLLLLVQYTFFPITFMVDAFSFGYYVVSLIVFFLLAIALTSELIRNYTVKYKSFIIVTFLWVIIRFSSNASDPEFPVIVDEKYFMFAVSLCIGAFAYWRVAEFIITDKFGKRGPEWDMI